MYPYFLKYFSRKLINWKQTKGQLQCKHNNMTLKITNTASNLLDFYFRFFSNNFINQKNKLYIVYINKYCWNGKKFDFLNYKYTK